MSDVVKLSLPKEIESFLGEPIDRKVREMIVLQLYREGKISFGKAKDLAGVDTWEMLNLLIKNDIYLDYSAVDLGQDLITLRQKLKPFYI